MMAPTNTIGKTGWASQTMPQTPTSMMINTVRLVETSQRESISGSATRSSTATSDSSGGGEAGMGAGFDWVAIDVG